LSSSFPPLHFHDYTLQRGSASKNEVYSIELIVLFLWMLVPAGVNRFLVVFSGSSLSLLTFTPMSTMEPVLFPKPQFPNPLGFFSLTLSCKAAMHIPRVTAHRNVEHLELGFSNIPLNPSPLLQLASFSHSLSVTPYSSVVCPYRPSGGLLSITSGVNHVLLFV